MHEMMLLDLGLTRQDWLEITRRRGGKGVGPGIDIASAAGTGLGAYS
jgi:hypothetical protein